MDSAPVFRPTRSKYIVFTADYLLPLTICLCVILLGYVVLYAPFFKIEHTECTVDYQPCSDPTLLAEIDRLKGQNIFRLATNKLSARLTSSDFTIREAHIIRVLPNSVSITLQSVAPVVALKVEGIETWIVLDPDLRVIATRGADPNVPTVLVSTQLVIKVGQRPKGESIIKTLELALRLSEELFEVKTLRLIDADTIELALSSGMLAIFTPQKDEVVQLRALQAVLADATIIKGVRVIDVRFSQPVLR